MQVTSILTGALMLGGAVFSTLAGTLPAVVNAAPPPSMETVRRAPPAAETAALAQEAPGPPTAPVTLLAVEPEIVPASALPTPTAAAPAPASARATPATQPSHEVPIPPRRPRFDAAPPAPRTEPHHASAAPQEKTRITEKGALTLPAVPKSPVDKLAESLGVSSHLLESASPTAISSLERLPASVRTMYKNLDDRFKRLMVQKLEGKTSVLFTEISHKQAFIDGQAMGVDAFDKMHELVHENVDSGKIDASTARKLDQAIEAFRRMTREQRAAVVGLLERDVGRR